MNKRLLKWILIGAFSTLLMGAAVSCKDYSSDIENLQSQITALSGNVDYLQSLINAGKVVTSVDYTDEGVKISFSDGSSFTLTNGKDGADGTTPTISIDENGYWVINGNTTDVKAKGEDGTNGDTPYIGENGNWWIGDKDTGVSASAPTITIGTNGNWYVDGEDTGVKAQGEKGDTPTITIGTNGDWYVDGVDTGVKAQGESGSNGDTPYVDEDGYWRWKSDDSYVTDTNGEKVKATGDTPTIEISDDGYWVINGTKTDVKAKGDKGQDGTNYVWTIGSDGYWYLNDELYTDDNYPDGIQAVGKNGSTITISDETGNWVIDGVDTGVHAQGENGEGDTISVTTNEDGSYTITITHADGSEPDVITISNGEKGDTGADGADGADGSIFILKPNYTTGYWELYLITPLVTVTDDGVQFAYDCVNDQYMPLSLSDYGITAIWDGNTLHLLNVLTAHYDEDGNLSYYDYQTYDIYLGKELNSIAFVPNYIDSDTHYPTNDPVATITSYLSDDAEADDDGNYCYVTDDDAEDIYAEDGTTVIGSTAGDFVAQEGVSLGKSTVDLVYRLNPGNAYIYDAVYEFIDRTVATRSSDVKGDNVNNVLYMVGDPVHTEGSETVTVTALINQEALSDKEGEYSLAALRVYNGSNPEGVVTSDYIVVKGGGIDVSGVLVNTEETTEGEEGVEYHTRTKSLAYDNESSDFIKGFTGLETTETVTDETTQEESTVYAVDEDQVNFTLNYTSTDASASYFNIPVALYTSSAVYQYFYDIFGDAITYKYTVPEEYDLATGQSASEDDADDVEWENQQADSDGNYYITVGDTGNVTINSAYAVGKYPVVRVDAYYTVDEETEYLLASTYVQLYITGPQLDPVTYELGESWIYYREINGSYDDNTLDVHNTLTVAQFIAYVADASGLDIESLADVWTYYKEKDYGYAFYNVETGEDQRVDGDDDTTHRLAHNDDWTGNTSTSTSNQLRSTHGFGVHMYSSNDLEDEASLFWVGVNDQIHTQHYATYADRSAIYNWSGTYQVYSYYIPYLFTFTIYSQNTSVCPDIVIEWPFYVTDICPGYELNPIYKISESNPYYDADYANAVVAKGYVDASGNYAYVTDVTEHTTEKDNVFEVPNESLGTNGPADQNVDHIAFVWYETEAGVTPDVGIEIIDPDGTAVTGESTTDTQVGLDGTGLSEDYEYKHMTLNQVLKNGEYCPWDYWILFCNPFLAGEDGVVYLEDLTYATNARSYAPVEIYDLDGNLILSCPNIGTEDNPDYEWVVSDYAAETYKLSMSDFSFSYRFDESQGDYTYLTQYLPDGAVLTLYVATDDLPYGDDGNVLPHYADVSGTSYSAGRVVWYNGGTQLQNGYNIYVTVTVQISTIGSVEFTTIVKLNGGHDDDTEYVAAGLANVVL